MASKLQRIYDALDSEAFWATRDSPEGYEERVVTMDDVKEVLNRFTRTKLCEEE